MTDQPRPQQPENEPRDRPTSYAVVVATRHRPSLLRRCLASVIAQEPAPADVVVVDNSRGDAATADVAREANARYVIEPRAGLSRARNRGAAEAAADCVLFIDDDAVAAPGWAAGVLRGFDGSRVGAVSGTILTPASGDGADVPLPVFGARARFEVDRQSDHWFERLAFGGVGLGGNMAFRRTLFERGLRFNVHSGRGAAVTGGEEHLAFLDVVRMGYTVVHQPDAIVHHPWPSEPAAIRRHALRDLTAATGLLTLLLVEEPALRARTIRYAWQAVRGTRRHWRLASVQRDAPRLPRLPAAVALAWGPLRYLFWRARGALGR